MRIRPAIVTALSACISLTAIAVVVFVSTPGEASSAIIGLLWAALGIAVWSILATLFLVFRWTLSRAVWVALLLSLGGMGVAVLNQQGRLSQRLLIGIVLATLAGAGMLYRWLHSSVIHD